jgi:hypothetical protein
MVSFRQFADWTRHTSRKLIEDEEMSRRYQAYRENAQSKQLRAFFDEHREHEWYFLWCLLAIFTRKVY